MKKQFIYFPSFSVGSFGNNLGKDFKLRNGLSVQFYSEHFPEQYRHPYFLVTAGHFYKNMTISSDWGLREPGVVVFDDGITIGIFWILAGMN